MVQFEQVEEASEMAVYQVLVRNLDGRTRCLRFSSKEVLCEDLKAELTTSEGVPEDWQRLVCGTRELSRGSSIVADEDGVFPSCTLLLRLRGGKGGFGSLLRGAATKAGQKKTSNFDACRDMSGRRLRHVNSEKKMKEWKAEAAERELEKTAEAFLKKQRKVEEEDSGLAKELEKFREQSLKAREQVGSAVTDGLVEARKLGVDLKRKKVEAVEVEVKRARLRFQGESSESGSEDEDSDEDSDAEDEAGPSSSEKDEAGPSFSMMEDKHEASPSFANENEASPSGSDKEETSGSQLMESASQPESGLAGSGSKSSDLTTDCPDLSGASSPDSVCQTAQKVADGGEVDQHPASSSDSEGSVDQSPALSEVKSTAGPLNMADYTSAQDLEILGLERLKEELQKYGLKCGGNLKERAARLWLLKTIPLEKLDKKLFSKPPRK